MSVRFFCLGVVMPLSVTVANVFERVNSCHIDTCFCWQGFISHDQVDVVLSCFAVWFEFFVSGHLLFPHQSSNRQKMLVTFTKEDNYYDFWEVVLSWFVIWYECSVSSH